MRDNDKILNEFCTYMLGKNAALLEKMLPLHIEEDIKGLELITSSDEQMDYRNEDWVLLVKYWREFNKSKNYYH